MNTILRIIVTISLSSFCNCAVVVPKSPPHPQQAALMARYIMHNSDWVSMATISSQSTIKGYPFVSPKLVSDGPATNSTGIPYFYLTNRDVSSIDLQSDNRLTIMATLAQSDYSKTNKFDPQEPRYARVFISGQFTKVNQTSPDYTFGETSLFFRHPAIRQWPVHHGFDLAKVDPVQIKLLDNEGMKNVNVEDYFKANITNITNADVGLKSVI